MIRFHRLISLFSFLVTLAAPGVWNYAQESEPVVFQILFEWGGTSSIGSFKGTAVGSYAPSSQWTGHSGVNWKLIRGKGIDETSPAGLYRGLGSLAAMRENDLLQFYRIGYTATATTDNGCSFTDTQVDSSDTYTAWINKSKDGAVLQFGTLEAGDVEGKCDHYDVSFTREFEEDQVKLMEEFFTFRLTNQDLASFKTIRKVNTCSLQASGTTPGEIWGKATLATVIQPDELEVTVVPDQAYDSWQPKGNVKKPGDPGNDPLRITITVHKKGDQNSPRKANLIVSIPYVSKNKGVCGNWPTKAGEEEGLRFRQEDFPEKEGLLFVDRTHLQTDTPLEEAAFRVYAYDYGAWGTLRVSATDENGKEIKVNIRGWETMDLDVPLDENANRIADPWEHDKVSADRDWDAEEAVGQDQKGDGITLYSEYRGLVVLEGGKPDHIRLSPLKKEIFILDPANSFPGKLWKDQTDIEVFLLDESLVDQAGNPEGSPLVNFNALDHGVHPCFALRVKTISGDSDPEPAIGENGKPQPATTTDPSFPLMAYAYSNGTIRSADYIKVFPDRARLMLNHYLEWLDLGLKSPNSMPGQELRDPKNLFTVDEAFQAWTALCDPLVQAVLVKKMLNVFFIHEVGHICGGLPDHTGNPPVGHKEEARACFMWNLSIWDQRRLIVLSALGRGDPNFAYAYKNFCRDMPVSGFHCCRSLKVKDW